MTYWWQRYTNTPQSNDNPPPDGAPENHFPDQVNNIQRQAMAAINEIGSLVLGPALAGDPPETSPTINGAFLKLIYDQLLPINTIQAWDSVLGTKPFLVPDFPEFTGVLWEQCDATGSVGTPDLQDNAIIGAHSAGGSEQTFTGEAVGAGDTGDGGAISLTNRETDNYTLLPADVPVHDHDYNDPGHDHGLQQDRDDKRGPGPGQVVISIKPDSPNVLTAVAFTGITHNPAGGDGAHKHGAPDVTVADHVHETGTPPGIALEYYKRVS
jgi:hypothetical protein